MIAIVDYGAGNLRSVAKAVASLGYKAKITQNPAEVLAADAVILPGVGAAGDAMARLKEAGLVEALTEVVRQGRPFLGVCLGLQLLFTDTEEGGKYPCLDILSGRVKRFPPGLKIPHMGWNQVQQRFSNPLFEGIPQGAYFYFVHSYYAEPEESWIVAADTDYGITFSSMVVRGSLVATQFHPEKSGALGLRFYDNFLRLAGV